MEITREKKITPPHVHIDTDNEFITKELLKQIDAPMMTLRGSNKDTALHIACEKNLNKTAEVLLFKNPCLTSIRNKQGNIPLHITSAHGNKKGSALLLSHNITTIDWQNYHGETALHVACHHQQFAIIKQLVKNNACTTIKDNNQSTPFARLFFSVKDSNAYLFRAFEKEHPHTMQKLIHSKDNNNNTQLHLCAILHNAVDAEFTFKEYLAYLINNKVDVHAKNKNGKQAVDLACQAFNQLNDQYIVTKLPKLKDVLMAQEHNMHAFLRVSYPYKQYAFFQQILSQKSLSNQPLLKKLRKIIAYFYYALNIETIIAKKYKNDEDYYNDFVENKNEIKKQLLIYPQPKLL